VPAGEFIGSGSFGRVYQGTYCSRRVAVKVMEHCAEATEDIQNEMVLQMSFKNRCVVAAYKCLTYARSAAAAGSSSDSVAEGEFALYVAPMSTHNSTSHSTPGGPLNATPGGLVADWRGLNVNCTAGSSGTPPLAATGSRQQTSSRASGEGQQPPTKLATWLLQVIDKELYNQALLDCCVSCMPLAVPPPNPPPPPPPKSCTPRVVRLLAVLGRP
jgi:hypothetical protein